MPFIYKSLGPPRLVWYSWNCQLAWTSSSTGAAAGTGDSGFNFSAGQIPGVFTITMVSSTLVRGILACVVGLASRAAAEEAAVAVCSKSIVASPGDTCATLASAAGITVTQFIRSNPNVASCSQLLTGALYCIEGTATGPPTIPATGPSSPSPTATASPSESDPLKVSADGTCGPGVTCAGSRYGTCCSAHGFCGSTSDYCGEGCQLGLGTCGDASSPPEPEPEPSSTAPPPVISTPPAASTVIATRTVTVTRTAATTATATAIATRTSVVVVTSTNLVQASTTNTAVATTTQTVRTTAVATSLIFQTNTVITNLTLTQTTRVTVLTTSIVALTTTSTSLVVATITSTAFKTSQVVATRTVSVTSVDIVTLTTIETSTSVRAITSTRVITQTLSAGGCAPSFVIGTSPTFIIGPTPTRPSLVPTPTPVRPSPILPGAPSNCKSYDQILKTDNCRRLATRNSISLQNFYKLNPSVSTSILSSLLCTPDLLQLLLSGLCQIDCDDLWVGYYVCVGT
ncbi:hypothetical protein B0T25DRAFT_567505 [Lasiosphaeria hispida]|uniref:Carbohydrate-binding module family 18 protein n=1 Tax=Lasiosphaeria hispida TaxID=260671 RepID=A0AAJ0MD84_9PEZI|nr:hypothetical protein B0T25DRAFT_567505 [Lasiosphaeria hispida]